MDKEIFEKDIKYHQMKIIHNSGLYRHLKFKAPETSNHWFEIMTFPWSLIINGDMGTYSFSRIDDMFAFFRRKDLSINAGYWAEKCTAQNAYGSGIKTWDSDLFHKNIKEYIEDHCDSDKKENVLSDIHYIFSIDNEYEAVSAIYGFKFHGFDFQDFFMDYPCESYTYRFLWCLYAIVWGIQKYDEF